MCPFPSPGAARPGGSFGCARGAIETHCIA